MQLKESASRFEFATMHFGSIAGLAKAIEYLCDHGIEKVLAHANALADQLIVGAKSIPGLELVSTTDPAERSPITTFRIRGASTEFVVEELERRKIIVSNRTDLLRLSPHVYNTSGDMTLLLNALQEILEACQTSLDTHSKHARL